MKHGRERRGFFDLLWPPLLLIAVSLPTLIWMVVFAW